MRRLACALAAVALLCGTGNAQTVPGRLLPPGSIDFFKETVRQKGVLPAIVSTADYMTRSGRIGSAQHHDISVIPSFIEGTGIFPAEAEKPRAYISNDYDFVGYLIGNGMEKDAVTLLSKVRYFDSDTLYYLRGWAAYSARMLEDATSAFDKVPADSPFYDKSLFYDVISNVHLGDYARGSGLLRGYGGPYKELKCLEEAGIALLEGRAADFVTAANGFTYSQYALTDSERQLQGIYNERYFGRTKNPALAAAASALVPGLGKVYAGELAEGISSFLTVGSFAAITAENWAKHGLKNWKTILFGAMGAVFYIGNIYGSYISVSIHNEELKDVQDTAILYHIHIPLRSVFQ
jgi:hypothetical protein